jgi:hypothetical protein
MRKWFLHADEQTANFRREVKKMWSWQTIAWIVVAVALLCGSLIFYRRPCRVSYERRAEAAAERLNTKIMSIRRDRSRYISIALNRLLEESRETWRILAGSVSYIRDERGALKLIAEADEAIAQIDAELLRVIDTPAAFDDEIAARQSILTEAESAIADKRAEVEQQYARDCAQLDQELVLARARTKNRVDYLTAAKEKVLG